MADPEADHGMILDDNSFLSLQSPYLDFGWDGNSSVQDYINRVAPEIADEMEFRLGINERQDRYHSDIPLHPNLQTLVDLAPPRQTAEERMAQLLRYALPSPTTQTDELRTDPEHTETWQVTHSDYVIIGLIAVSIYLYFT
jgi:hypothetical protein